MTEEVKTGELKMNYRTAEEEFTRFAELMCIDIDPAHMTEDDMESFEKHKSRMVKAIANGHLVINSKGEPVYTPYRSENADPITFYEPTGATLTAMDRRGKNQEVSRMYEAMGSLTKTFAAKFSKMALPDLKVCQAITIFFLV